VSPDEAVAGIRSGMKIFVHGAAATPTTLLDALARRTDLQGVIVYHLHTAGPAPFAAPDKVGQFRSVSLFTGAPLRGAIDEGRADFVPIFLSDIPGLFLSGRVKLDAALLSLSVPDRHGFCTLGTSVDAARAAADTATLLIAEVNTQMPRTRGNVVVPIDRLDVFIATERSASRSLRWSKTARRSRWGSAGFRTRCCDASATSSNSACTPRCSRMA
jgi:acyl-CoA hydrolase